MQKVFVELMMNKILSPPVWRYLDSVESLLLKVRSLLHHEAAAGQATSHQHEGGSPHAQGPARTVHRHGARSENDANQVWTFHNSFPTATFRLILYLY